MIFIDASVIVACLDEEKGFEAFIDALEVDPDRMTSPVALYEAVGSIARNCRAPLDVARTLVMGFVGQADAIVAEISQEDAHLALDPFARYGKGRGHPAQLNMGDCFAYAAATRHGAALLFKGGDFAATDIRSALPS